MKANILKRPIGKVITVWCAFATLTTSFTPVFAGTLVLPEAELNGYTGINTPSAYTGTEGAYSGSITGTGGNAVLDWNTLSINKGNTLTFNNGTFYNVVSGSSVSQLLGSLKGDTASVYIFNPNGILIGGGATINVSGIFGAYAMKVDPTTLNSWLIDADATKITTSSTGSITVENGAQIQAAAIALAGKRIDLKEGDVTKVTKFDGPTTLTLGGELVLDKVQGGNVSVVFSDGTSASSEGLDLMGDFTKALTIETEANGKVMVVGKTTVAGDVTINAGSISSSKVIDDAAAIETTDGGKLTATAKNGDIDLGAKDDDTYVWNKVDGEVALKADNGDVTFYNSADTTLIGDVMAKSVTIEAAKDLIVNSSKSVAATENNANITAGGKLTVNGVTTAVKGNTYLEATDNIAVNSGANVNAKTDVSLESNNGAITVSGLVGAGGKIELTAKNDVTVESGFLSGVTGNEGVSLESTDERVTVKGFVIASGGDVTATANKAVTVSGAITAAVDTENVELVGGNVELTGGTDVTVSGKITAAQDVTVEATEATTVSGTVSAGTMKEGPDDEIVVTGGDVKLTGNTVEVTSDGSVSAAAAGSDDGNVELIATSTVDGDKDITVAGTVTADGNVTATAVNNITVNGSIEAAKAVTLQSTGEGLVKIEGVDGATALVKANGGTVKVFADGGSVKVNNATVKAVGDNSNVNIKGKNDIEVTGVSKVVAGKAVKLTSTTEGNVTIEGTDDTKATVKANTGAVTISAADGAVKVNKAKVNAVKGKVNISGTGAIDITGASKVVAAKAVTVKSTNEGNITIEGTTDAAATVKAKDGAVTIAANNGAVTIDNVTVTAKRSADATQDSNGTIDIDATGVVTVKGASELNAAKDITVDTTGGSISVEDTSSKLIASGDVALTAKSPEGAPTEAEKNISIAGSVMAAKDVTIDAESAVTVSGTIDAGTTMDADGVITATGGDVSLTAGTGMEVTGAVTARAAEDEDGTVIGGNVTATAVNDITVKGPIEAAKAVTVKSTGIGDITIEGTESSPVSVTGNGGTVKIVAKGGSVKVNNATVKAKGDSSNVNIKGTKDIDVTGVSKVVAGKAVKLTSTTEGNVTIDGGATSPIRVKANGGAVTITATEGAVKVNNATVKALGDKGNVDISGTGAIDVTGVSKVVADKVVTVKSTDEGNITIEGTTDAAATVKAKDGAVTIAANNGAVTIDKATVTAKRSADAAQDSDNGTIDIDATGAVTVKGASELNAAKDITVDTTGGSISVEDTSSKLIAAGDVALTAKSPEDVSSETEKNITIAGTVTAGKGVTATAEKDITVKGSVAANDGNVTLTAEKGAVDIIDGVGVNATQNVTVEAAKHVQVLNGSTVTAGKAVTLKSTDEGNVKIEGTDTATALVKANNGAVTIAANNGAVSIDKASVTAAGKKGTIDIDATKGVAVSDGATLTAAKDIDITATGGNVTTAQGTSLTAGGNLVVFADNETTDPDGNITIKGKVDVTGTTDLDAKGSIVADNDANDFQDVVDATAEKGEVTLKDKDSIKLGDIDAGTVVNVTAVENIEVVKNGGGVEAGKSVTFEAGETGSITVNDKVHAGNTADEIDNGIRFTAGDSIAVNAEVVNEQENITGIASAGNITFGEAGSMRANNGSVSLIAKKDIDSANKDTAITASDTIGLWAKEGNIGSPLNVSSPYLQVLSAGSANIAMQKSDLHESGDLAVNGTTTSIETGKDLKLVVEGNLSTPDGGIIRVGNNLDLTVNSATPEVNLTLGGNSIRAENKTQSAIAFKLNGGTQFPEVIGTDSDTAVFIDGRVAGGDSALFSILESYEAQAALGMTPDIRGAVIEKTPKAYYDQKLHVNDYLPNVWDEQIDDKEVVPQEVTAKEQASDTVAMR